MVIPWFRNRKSSNSEYKVPYTNAPSGREIGSKSDCCEVDQKTVMPDWDKIIDDLGINLCSPLPCWDIDFTKVGDISLDEISSGEVVEKKLYPNSDKSKLFWENGTAILDRLMEFASENLRIQADNGRISNGADYKDAYIASMQTVMQIGIQALLQSKDMKLRAIEAYTKSKVAELEQHKLKLELENLKFQQELTKEMFRKAIVDREMALEQKRLLKIQQENLREQTRLYERQRIGFNDNLFIKLLEAQMSSYSMIYSSGLVDSDVLPDPLNSNELKDVYTKFKYRTQECDSDGNPLPIVEEYSIDRRVVEPESKFCL